MEEIKEEVIGAETTEQEEPSGPLSETIQLFKHESFTDGNLVYIDVMTPIKLSGTGKVSIDKERKKTFIGKTQVDFSGKVGPYTFMIEDSNNVKEAIDKFDDALEAALDRTREQVENMRKEQESKVIVPNDNKGKIIT